MQRGFTLVETIVATTLLAGALVALAQFVGAGVQSGAAARARSASTQIAGQKMEQMRAMSWAAIAAMPADSTEYLDSSGNQRCPGASAPCGDAVYVRRWTVAPSTFSADVLIIAVEAQLVGKGHGRATLATARGRMTP